MQVIPLPGWLEALQARAECGDEIAKLPAIRILDFFQRLSQPTSKSDYALDTSEAMKYSETMARLAPVNDQWIRIWMRQWGVLK